MNMPDQMKLWQLYCREMPEFLQKAAQLNAMQRLQQVGMNCGCEYTSFPLFSGIAPYSRFDHSMGVALIVWHFTHKPEEALAGLFHDIATPAFAHVIDFLHGDHLNQETTEAGTAERIREDKQIRNLLELHRLTPSQVENYHIYPIADNDSPQLSADRLEYTFGNSINYKILTHREVEMLYRDLTIGINEHRLPEIMFRSSDCALLFSRSALKCARIYVSDPDRYAMQYLAELLQSAITRGILQSTDLYSTEPKIIQKLIASPFREEWNRFRCFCKICTAPEPGPTGKWRRIPAKKRFIDPYVAAHGRVSTLFPGFRNELEEFKRSSQEHWLYAE